MSKKDVPLSANAYWTIITTELAVEIEQAKFVELSTHILIVILIPLKAFIHTKLSQSHEIKTMAYIGITMSVLAFSYPVYILMGYNDEARSSTNSKKDSILTIDWWRPSGPPSSFTDSSK